MFFVLTSRIEGTDQVHNAVMANKKEVLFPTWLERAVIEFDVVKAGYIVKVTY